jgi:hypothetical protein
MIFSHVLYQLSYLGVAWRVHDPEAGVLYGLGCRGAIAMARCADLPGGPA